MKKRDFFYQNSRSSSECGFFLRIFWRTCLLPNRHLTFHPYCSTQQGASCCHQSWGEALRDVIKGTIAERTYIMYVRRDATLRWLRTYIAWSTDQLSDVRQLPLYIYSNDDGCVYFRKIVLLEVKHEQLNIISLFQH